MRLSCRGWFPEIRRLILSLEGLCGQIWGAVRESKAGKPPIWVNYALTRTMSAVASWFWAQLMFPGD